MKSLIAALALVIVSTFTALAAPAQTLKWTYSAGGSAWATDGRGGLAIVAETGGGAMLGTVTWIDRGGQPLSTNVIADLGANIARSSIRIVRFTKTELVVQVEASYEYAPGTNYLRRFRRNGNFSDTVLPIGEQMDAQSSTLADSHGYFTREVGAGGAGFNFRRYSN
jgi:hypothetical protein